MRRGLYSVLTAVIETCPHARKTVESNLFCVMVMQSSEPRTHTATIYRFYMWGSVVGVTRVAEVSPISVNVLDLTAIRLNFKLFFGLQ